MDYGSVFYGSASDIYLKKLQVSKNRYLRLCLGLLKTTPTNVLEIGSCEPSLNLRRQYLSDKIATKMYLRNSKYIDNLHNLTLLNLLSTYWSAKKFSLTVISYLKLSEASHQCYNNNLDPYYNTKYEFIINEVKIHYLNINIPLISNIRFQHELKSR